MRWASAHQKHIAVRIGARDGNCTEVSAGTWTVFDYDRLPQSLPQWFGNKARQDVRRSSGAKRHDHPYRARRPILRLNDSRTEHCQAGDECTKQFHHSSSGFIFPTCLPGLLRLKG
jgi:hypothetical protein